MLFEEKRVHRLVYALGLATGGAIGLLPNVSAAALTPTLDFGIIAPTTGSISYAGGASPLLGSGIQVDNIVGLDTPLNAGTESLCALCVLNFGTGNFVSHIGNVWTYSGGGSISIKGGVDFDPVALDGLEIASGSTLLTGTFNTAQVFDLGSGAFQFRIAGASFIDKKHADLLAFYGLPINANYQGGMNISFLGATNGGGGFTSSSVFSGDITNQPLPVPLPAAFLLFLSGIGVILPGRMMSA